MFVLLAKKVSIRITSSKTLEFIVAKNPKKVYKFNFLHLILNSDVDTIVMLEDIRLENNYFSEYEDKNLTVETVATIETVKYVRRDICITFANHGKIISRKIKQFLYCNWESMPDIPNDRNDIIEFIKEVNKDRNDLERPILVHSASGSGRSSLYISLNVIIEQIKENGVFI